MQTRPDQVDNFSLVERSVLVVENEEGGVSALFSSPRRGDLYHLCEAPGNPTLSMGLLMQVRRFGFGALDVRRHVTDVLIPPGHKRIRITRLARFQKVDLADVFIDDRKRAVRIWMRADVDV